MKHNLYFNNKNVTGELIKKYRQLRKISGEKLCAKLALLGITLYASDIYSIENNLRTIRDFELIAICKILSIDFSELNQYIELD